MNRNKWMNEKHKKLCTPKYIEHSLILGSTISRCVFISVFASLFGILLGIKSSAIGLKICAISARIKKYKSTTKKKGKNSIVSKI